MIKADLYIRCSATIKGRCKDYSGLKSMKLMKWPQLLVRREKNLKGAANDYAGFLNSGTAPEAKAAQQ